MEFVLEFTPPIATGVSHKSTHAFLKHLNEDSLVLRPAFQRNMVWNHEQKGFLVDSILRGLPVPEIYIQTTVSADGVERLIVIDGQQRITTCLAFLLGELRLADSEDLDKRWRGRTFSELDDKLRQRFRSFQLIVRELPDLEPGTLREVFRRLNKTVESLEAQELRHAAYTGPFVSLVERFAAQSALEEISVFSPKDYLRRRNDELIAEVCFAVASGAYPNKKDGLDDFFVVLENPQAAADKLPDLRRRLGRVLQQLEFWSASLKRSRFRNKSDLYTLMVLLAKNAERLPLCPPNDDRAMTQIREFSNLVNEIKRQEGSGSAAVLPSPTPAPAEFQDEGLSYLRAVERAASDRLSRVRREDALLTVIGSLLEEQDAVPLAQSDEDWMYAPLREEMEVDENSPLEDRIRAQRCLTEALPGAELPAPKTELD